MARKFSEARRKLYLGALRATGNRTMAAEQAKVSRSWVTRLRSQDAAFGRAVDAAIDEAQARLAEHPERRPPTGWGFLDDEELVVIRSGGKRVQIARARPTQWSPRVEDRFLATLAATCNVEAACAEAGRSKSSAYGHRRRWPAFSRRWKAAVEEGYERLELGLIEAGGNFLSGEDLPDPVPMPGMTVDHAIHLLHMHKHEVHQLGRRRSRRAREPDIEVVRAEFLRVAEAIGRADKRKLARDKRAWARRRPRRDGPGEA